MGASDRRRFRAVVIGSCDREIGAGPGRLAPPGTAFGSPVCGRRGAVPSLPDRAARVPGLARRDRAETSQAEETRA